MPNATIALINFSFHSLEDRIWTYKYQINLSYAKASEFLFGQTFDTSNLLNMAGIRNMVIANFKRHDVHALVMNDQQLQLRITDNMSFEYLGAAYYFLYKHESLPIDAEPNYPINNLIGNIDVPVSPSAALNQSQYIVTGEMNGCAIIVTKEADENTFKVWHLQSPGSHRGLTERLVRNNYLKIYGFLYYREYGEILDRDETVCGCNYLFYDIRENKWIIKCIPLKYYVDTADTNWPSLKYEFSRIPRSEKEIDFSKPLYDSSVDKENFINDILNKLMS